MMTLAITIAYYSLFALSHYFGRPSFSSANEEEMVDSEREHVVDPNKSVFGAFQEQWPGLFRGDRFQPGYKFKVPRFSVVLLFNVPFTFLLIFSVFLYNRKIMGKSYRLRRDELLINIVGTLLIASVLSAICTILQLYIWPNRPDPNRSLLGYISRGLLGDLSLVAIAFVFSYLQRSLYQEKKIAVENETLRAENLRTRYEALKNQLDPHFLFNSMNTLQSLITIDTDRAEGCIRDLQHAYTKDGGLAVLFGNIAQDGCVVKTAGVDESLWHFEGPAVVFDSQEDACEGILGGKVKKGDCVVITHEGPKGGPGMQEMLYPTSYIKSMHMGKECALITDGRFSGGTSGLSIGHISPEAANGGNIGKVKDGDIIVIDIPSRSINVKLSDDELAARPQQPLRRNRVVSKALRAYAQSVSSADKGGIRIID